MRRELTPEQIRYLNGTALQELMQLDPDYAEGRKREIYQRTIGALSLFIVEEYWRLEKQSGAN